MKREVVLVCGVTGSGKTQWSKHFTKAFSRLLVYDIACSFPVNYIQDRAQFADLVRMKPKAFRYGVYDPRDTDVMIGAGYLLGDCWCVLEEISTLFSIGARINGPLQEAVLLGRQRSLSLLCISQRASYIPITLRSQASRVVSFRQQESADVKWLADFIGKEAAESLPTLPDLHCIDWHKGAISSYAIPLAGVDADRAANTQTQQTDQSTDMETPPGHTEQEGCEVDPVGR